MRSKGPVASHFKYKKINMPVHFVHI